MPQLTVHNAQISTASVEIKTLTISGKQVTLAVFRQLREEDLFAGDGALNGVPWGTVNYHPDKCADQAEHWHVVWQKGADLRRSLVSVRPGFEREDWCSDYGDDFLDAHVRDYLHGTAHFFAGKIGLREGPLRYRSEYEKHLVLTEEAPGIRVQLFASGKAVEAAAKAAEARKAEAANDSPSDWLDKLNEAAKVALAELDDELARKLTPTDTTESLHAEYRRELDAEVARRKRHHEARLAIADLPQLFIAV